MGNRIHPYADAVKAFIRSEICLERISQEDISPEAYVFYYDTFVFFINQMWELFKGSVRSYSKTDSSVKTALKSVDTLRGYNLHANDEGLVYLRVARNQLTHRQSIVWMSDETKKPKDLNDGRGTQPFLFLLYIVSGQ